MSKYTIFDNPKLGKKLIYYPCPKNANTSAKLFFARHGCVDEKYLFIGDDIPESNQKEEDYKGKKNLISFILSKQPFEKRDVDIKCCIVRDPIKRFLSAYKNRILFHQDTGFKSHTIDMVLKKLEDNKFENLHFLPQTFFLGDSLDYYTFWATPEKIDIFVNNINDFFGRKVDFPRIQTGGKDFKIQLSKSQIRRIEKIYYKDFLLIDK